MNKYFKCHHKKNAISSFKIVTTEVALHLQTVCWFEQQYEERILLSLQHSSDTNEQICSKGFMSLKSYPRKALSPTGSYAPRTLFQQGIIYPAPLYSQEPKCSKDIYVPGVSKALYSQCPI